MGFKYAIRSDRLHFPLGRQVLVQNANLRTLKKWIFTKYDIKGRVVMTGLYYNPADTAVQAIQTLLDGVYSASNSTYPANSYYEDRLWRFNKFNR